MFLLQISLELENPSSGACMGLEAHLSHRENQRGYVNCSHQLCLFYFLQTQTSIHTLLGLCQIRWLNDKICFIDNEYISELSMSKNKCH